MGIGLSLIGKLSSKVKLETWFNGVWEWLSTEFPGMATGAGLGQGPFDEYPFIDLRFHPAADPVKIWLPEPKVLNLTADTASAGPGYHLFLCDLLRAMGQKFKISWDGRDEDEETKLRNNPTFFSGDPEQAYREMFNWLRTMAASANMMAGTGSFHLSMPPTHQFMSELPLITPMGPRSAEWLQEVSKNPGAGADVFPWLNPGVGPEFLLNRALVHMWADVRWCPPIADGDEKMLRKVLDLLEQAYKLNPNLNYPWREWSEIFGFLKMESGLSAYVDEKATKAPAAEPIGYRRREVRVMLDQGWSVTVPGCFAETGTYDPETHNHTWEFWNNELLIWFTTYPTCADETGKILPIAEMTKELDQLQANLGQLVEEEAGAKIWRRTFETSDPDKKGSFRFSSILLVAGRLALTHVFADKAADLEHALTFFKSIDNSAGSATKYIEQPRVPRLDLVCAN
jgi:hypothetical protein